MEHRDDIVTPELWHMYNRQLLDIPQITTAISENFKFKMNFSIKQAFFVVNYIQNT
jgi:hypothetical protein